MGDVARFPRFKLTDVAASLRTLADQIDSGERPVRRAVVCMETEEGGADYCAIGEDFSRFHAAGLCHSIAREVLE